MTVRVGATNPRAIVIVAATVVVAIAAGIGLAVLSAGRDPDQANVSPSAPPPSADASMSAPESMSPTEEPTPSDRPTPPPTPDPTPDPTPTPLPSGAAEIDWTQGDRLDGRVNAVAAVGGTWMAGGAILDGSTSRAAVWRSADGLIWTGPILLPPQPVEQNGFFTRYVINGFGAWDGKLVAFGWMGFGCCDGGGAMLWQSADGETWTVVDTAGTAFGDTFHSPVSSVTTDDGRLVVRSITGLGGGASIFSTTDLESWTEHPISSFDPTFTFDGFAASPTGWLAVGSYLPGWTDRPRPEQRLWSSADGLTWTPIEPPAPGGSLNDIAWDEVRQRFVIVGFDERDLPAVWLTEDGRSWARTTLDDQPGSAGSVSASDGLLVVTGHDGPPYRGDGRPVAWTSHDGVTWRSVLLTEQGMPLTATESGRAVVVLDIFSEDLSSSWRSWAGAAAE